LQDKRTDASPTPRSGLTAVLLGDIHSENLNISIGGLCHVKRRPFQSSIKNDPSDT
jgi:hypothetical protein